VRGCRVARLHLGSRGARPTKHRDGTAPDLRRGAP
jgi:hypothetical protein